MCQNYIDALSSCKIMIFIPFATPLKLCAVFNQLLVLQKLQPYDSEIAFQCLEFSTNILTVYQSTSGPSVAEFGGMLYAYAVLGIDARKQFL